MDKKAEKRKAIAALNKVIKNKIDIDDAFFCSLGSVSLKYGNPGLSDKSYKKGFGVSHIISKRDYEHAKDPNAFPETGLQVVKKLMDVIVYGRQSRPSKLSICKKMALRQSFRKTGMAIR